MRPVAHSLVVSKQITEVQIGCAFVVIAKGVIAELAADGDIFINLIIGTGVQVIADAVLLSPL